jgi:cytochrome c553
MMKIANLKLAISAAILAALVPSMGCAGDLKDKIEFCKNCHGARGEGFKGYYVAPRLAGQPVKYLQSEFQAIVEHRRDDPAAQMFMVVNINSIGRENWNAVAQYYSTLNPGPAADGPKRLVNQGKQIFEDGLPDIGVPACAGCHGADARGNEEFPRLAGQLYPYTVAQLTGWNKGYRHKDPVTPGQDNTMLPIATHLTQEQISAVAAYLSYLK